MVCYATEIGNQQAFLLARKSRLTGCITKNKKKEITAAASSFELPRLEFQMLKADTMNLNICFVVN